MLSHSRKYRPDIDGLRAIAVLFVLGFHAFPEFFPGGFCGVDVFFVISGFLISGIIFEELEGKRFSYATFYKRRVTRIFPALLVVLTACLGIGWFLLFDWEYAELGREVVHGAAFISNFLSWQQSGYFDRAASTKPLLHLWSLGIEEQFYLLWPPVLFLVHKLSKSFFWVTLLIAVISFGFNLGYLHYHSIGAYYSPLSRFWELMIGAFLAQRIRHRPVETTGGWRSFAGLALIALSLFVINEKRDFPGWWALLPTVGAYQIISAGQSSWVNRRVLSQPLLVGIGLISYPLYLWHWPLLSFVRTLEGDEPDWKIRVVVLSLSRVLAWLTYRFVEQPLRRTRKEKGRLHFLGWGMVSIAAAGLIALHSHGLRFRGVVRAVAPLLSQDAGGDGGNLEPGCGAKDPGLERQFGVCLKDKRGRASIALIGDSKAQALYPGLVRLSDPSTRLLIISGHGSGGTPLPVISGAPIYATYQGSIQAASDLISNNPDIKVVIITAAARALFQLKDWYHLDDLPGNPNFDIALAGLDRAVTKFIRAGKKVVLTVDNPTLPDPRDCVPRYTGSRLLDRCFRTHERRGCTIAYGEHLRISQTYRALLDKLQKLHPDELRLFDPTDLLCDIGNNQCSFQREGHLLYSYTDHLSDYASGLIGAKLLPFVQQFARLDGKGD